MSRVHRQNGKPFYFGYFYDQDGIRRCWSTKTPNKKQAEEICARWEQAARRARYGRLTPDAARKIIDEGVAAIAAAAGVQICRQNIKDYLDTYLQSKKASESTIERYQSVVDAFVKHLGPRAKLSLQSLSTQDLQEFRDLSRKRVSPGTVNFYLKILRTALRRAEKADLIGRNPMDGIDNVHNAEKLDRRAFTLSELKHLIELATEEWKTMILIGLYTGLRLQDVANLTWNNVDLVRAELRLTTRKTGRSQVLPIAKPLLRHLGTLPAGDEPSAALCPGLAGKGSGWLSNQFYGIMVAAGLVKSRSHQAEKMEDLVCRNKPRGRGARRTLNEISFHSLRHTATSLLKRAGVSDVIARDIIGHESEAVSRNYTHIDEQTKRNAMDKLPDIFRDQESQGELL